MFTIRKLLRLPYKTRLRKLVLILQKAEVDMAGGRVPDLDYFYSLLETIVAQAPAGLQEQVQTLKQADKSGLRSINAIRHSLLQHLGSESSEWDFVLPESGQLDSRQRTVFPARIFLEEVRSPFNVGSIFRTAESFGVAHIYLSPGTPLPDHKKAARTARGTAEILPWSVAALGQLQYEPAVFALETGGTPIGAFPFPAAGTVLIGSEELGLSPEALALADKSAGRVTIPLLGVKRSLNVAVAFGILMQHWCTYLQDHLQK